MQPHEGPRRDGRAEERERRRQRVLTWWLSGAIVILATAALGMMIWR